jgi:hypothetical protein
MSMGWTIQDGYGYDLSTAYMEWMGVACVYSNGSLMFPAPTSRLLLRFWLLERTT